MQLRPHHERTYASVFAVAARKHGSVFALAALVALAALGCHTWQGVKEDTRSAVHETGSGLEKAGKKMKGADEKKPANTRAKEADSGAPSSQH